MTNRPAHRPFRFALAAILFAGISIWNGWRLVAAIFFWPTLAEYHSSPGPGYIVLTGGFWMMVGVVVTGGLWWGSHWGRPVAITAALGYAVWYWFDRLVLQSAPHENWPFTLVVTALLLFIILSCLISRSAFHSSRIEAYERKSQNRALEGTKGKDEAGGRNGTS